MAFARSTINHGKLFTATILAFGMLTTASYAYTQEQQQLCTGDAMRLCSDAIPDVDRVTACMVQHRAELSPGCKSVFRMEPTATPANYSSSKSSKPVSITPHKRG